MTVSLQYSRFLLRTVALVAGVSMLCNAEMPARKLQNIKVTEIKSGDTFVAKRAAPAKGETKSKVTINLAGIKAPPNDSKYGKEAVKFLESRLLGYNVNAEFDTPMDGWRVKLSGADGLIDRFEDTVMSVSFTIALGNRTQLD